MPLLEQTQPVSQANTLAGRNVPMPVAEIHAVKGHSMINVPDNMEIALFAMGCFWGVKHLYWEIHGVYSTPAGYSGGYTLKQFGV